MCTEESFIISVSFEQENKGVLLVGKPVKEKGKQRIDIVNAFEGKEAYDLYLKLKNGGINNEK